VTVFYPQGQREAEFGARCVSSFCTPLSPIQNVHCTFDVAPSTAYPAFLRHLAAKGWYQSGFYNVLYGLAQEETIAHSEIVVRLVHPDEKDLFVAAYCESFEVPNTDAYAYVRDSIRVLLDIPTNHCFVALIEKTVAAIFVLSVSQQIGYMALAATRPRFQNYGCQKVLLQTGLQQAAQAGCTLVVGQTAVASISQYNAQKVGLHLAYTKALWSFYEREEGRRQEPDPLNQ
jgi:ribosomal protein S18 acetylase RimI-like enzyme